jgi:hypothetical protein
MIDVVQGHAPFVAFAGAGGSMLPPSNLPGWTDFNTLLLECLSGRVAEYSRNRQPTARILDAFKEQRDKKGFFSPDFQAQLMEEEVGESYFRVWQSLDTDAFGPVHAGLAELAARGRLAAIITTNFDRLIEAALTHRNQAFHVFHDHAAFDALATRAEAGPVEPLPVLKIHGSIEDPASLVDTLKQRVVGRPKSLRRVLNVLLRQHPWLFLGYSGADFDYDRNYLGVLDSAPTRRGSCSSVARTRRPRRASSNWLAPTARRRHRSSPATCGRGCPTPSG